MSHRDNLAAGFRACYNQARGDIPKLVLTLRATTPDNPSQTKRIDQLRDNVDARLDEFKRAIELGPKHHDDALAILATARARQ